MADFLQHNWRYLLGAALIHVLFAGIFGLTMLNLGHDAPLPVLAIQATIVDSSKLRQAPSRPKQPEPAKPPVDTEAEAAAQREKEAAAQRDKEQQQKEQRQEQERQAQQREEEQKQQREREVKEQQVREQQEAERKRVAETEAKAQADAEAKAKAEADRKRVAEIERKQQAEAERRKAAEDAQAKAAREAELQRQLAEEEGRTQAVNAGLLNQYLAMIQQHVERQWNRPATARSGLDCEVRAVQTPTGTVLSAQVTQCNGDAAVKQSIEAAVLRASPLPLPPDPRLFQRHVTIFFRPAD